jgi:hypothetical protein
VTCAYYEGFADYHAMAILGAEIGNLSGGSFWTTNIEGDQARASAGGGLANDVEGTVASVMYRMTSSTDLALPGRYVADLGASCRWSTSNVRLRNIAELIWCAQGSLTSDDITNLGSQPGSLTAGVTQPSNFNATTFRSMWHGKLLGIP